MEIQSEQSAADLSLRPLILREHVYLGFWRQMCIYMKPILSFSSASRHLAYHPSETPWVDATLIKLHQHMTQPVLDHVPACQV